METKQMESEGFSGPREMAGACPSKRGGWFGGRDGSRGTSQPWEDGIQGKEKKQGSSELLLFPLSAQLSTNKEIGRASCRERV